MAATSPACWSEMTRRTPARPLRLSPERNSPRKTSSSELPIAMPSTSRSPDALTPVAITTALFDHLVIFSDVQIGGVKDHT